MRTGFSISFQEVKLMPKRRRRTCGKKINSFSFIVEKGLIAPFDLCVFDDKYSNAILFLPMPNIYFCPFIHFSFKLFFGETIIIVIENTYVMIKIII